jgi:DNA-binding transcriptional LysR family regulator
MAIPDIRLEDAEAFAQAVASGSLSAAGRVLGRSTKQIARQVDRLEHALGTTLLHRTTHALSLTADGRRVLAATEPLLEAGRAMLAAGAAPGDALAGELRVVVPSLDFGATAWVRELGARHPALTFRLETSDEPKDLVAEGMDLQITVQRPTQATPLIRRLHVLRSVLAAHPSYVARAGLPQTPEDLAAHECLLWHTSAPQTRWLLLGPDGAQSHVLVRGSFESSSSAVLSSALRDGIGVCGASWLASRDGADLVPVLPGWSFEPTPVYAVIPPANRGSPLVAAFLERAIAGLEAWF